MTAIQNQIILFISYLLGFYLSLDLYLLFICLLLFYHLGGSCLYFKFIYKITSWQHSLEIMSVLYRYDFLNINFGEEATKALAAFHARPLSR